MTDWETINVIRKYIDGLTNEISHIGQIIIAKDIPSFPIDTDVLLVLISDISRIASSLEDIVEISKKSFEIQSNAMNMLVSMAEKYKKG